MAKKKISDQIARKEQLIREQRTFEAMRLGLMGFEGKLCRIARMFGDPIYKQGSSNVETTYMEDPWELESEELPVFDEEEMSYQVGWHYDGLRRGTHLEILWQDEFRELKVHYKGRLVYHEIGGELEGYVPEEEWKDVINRLYDGTKKKERDNKKVYSEIIATEARRKQQEFLDLMKQKWGI